tara:strand:- start:814 stop:1182 length:369 start_codon:yes stop_codon:yes gene_type:complete
MNKEKLNQEIGKLKASLEAHESQVKDLQHDLKTAEQRLADADKPKLTEKQFSAIQDVIEQVVGNYSFDDADRYEFELGIEYDNKVYLSHISFDGCDDLADDIYKGVEDLFGITEEAEDTVSE